MGQTLCKKHGIDLEQVVLDIDEIQGEDPEKIVRDKAHKAFEATKKPVIVSDQSWNFVGLKGFPGAYMKSMNYWFSPQHFIDLMQHVEDRTVILYDFLAYSDEIETIIFRRDLKGIILTEPRGISGYPEQKVIAMDIDHGLSIAEVYDKGDGDNPDRFKDNSSPWEDLAIWYNQKTTV